MREGLLSHCIKGSTCLEPLTFHAAKILHGWCLFSKGLLPRSQVFSQTDPTASPRNTVFHRIWGLYKSWLPLLYYAIFFSYADIFLFKKCFFSPMKNFRIPPDRNGVCFFSEQLLGSRHTVLETGANILLQIPALHQGGIWLVEQA